MEGTARYCFGDTVAGVRMLLERTLAFRAEGLKTRTHSEKVAGYTLHVLTVTAPERPTRRERGLL